VRTPSTLRAAFARTLNLFLRVDEELRPRLANENDERWQRINLNLHLGEVVVEVKHGGHGKQADISADSKESGLVP
jgi:hypothetical protein